MTNAASRVDRKDVVTVPKELREALGLRGGEHVLRPTRQNA